MLPPQGRNLSSLCSRIAPLLLLLCIAPWLASAFSSSSPVVPQDVDALTQQVHELRHQIAFLQKDDSTPKKNQLEVPWKQWYHEAEERNLALAKTRDAKVEEAVMQIECLQSALAMADAERDCLAAELEQKDVAYATLQDTLNTVRQHHAENCESWQQSLDDGEEELSTLQQKHLQEVLMIQQIASIELDATTTQFQAELGATQTELQQVQERLQQREVKLQKRGSRIWALEQEKKSLRMLAKNSVNLVMRRFNKRAERLVCASRKDSSFTYVPPPQSQWVKKRKSITASKTTRTAPFQQKEKLPNHHPHIPHASWSLLPNE